MLARRICLSFEEVYVFLPVTFPDTKRITCSFKLCPESEREKEAVAFLPRLWFAKACNFLNAQWMFMQEGATIGKDVFRGYFCSFRKSSRNLLVSKYGITFKMIISLCYG